MKKRAKKKNMDDKNLKRKKLRALIITSIFGVITAGLALFLIFSLQFKNLRNSILDKTEVSQEIFEVTYFYAGQGDAVLIRDVRPDGKVMLIDSGPSAEVEEYILNTPGENRAKTTIAPYLREKGIVKIDYLVGTHKHGDHIGGFPYIIDNFEVGAYYDNGTDQITSPFVENLYEALDDNPQIDYKVARAGATIPFGEGVTCQILGPLKLYENTGSDENNSSIVLRFTVDEVSFLFAGDAEIVAELDLTSYGPGLNSTVMMAPHHGSTSSSSRPFLDMVRPEVAVFSCGRNNPYGFPPFEIIRRYEDMGAEIYRTDLGGHITAITDGMNYRITTQR